MSPLQPPFLVRVLPVDSIPKLLVIVMGAVVLLLFVVDYAIVAKQEEWARGREGEDQSTVRGECHR